MAKNQEIRYSSVKGAEFPDITALIANADDMSYLKTKSSHYNVSYTGKSFSLSKSLLRLVKLSLD